MPHCCKFCCSASRYKPASDDRIKTQSVIEALNNYVDKTDTSHKTFVSTGVGNHQMMSCQFFRSVGYWRWSWITLCTCAAGESLDPLSLPALSAQWASDCLLQLELRQTLSPSPSLPDSLFLILSWNMEYSSLTMYLYTHTTAHSHSHTMLITCTSCDDLTKGTQDKDFSYSF